ncbi:MAG: hypothetical protein MRY79_02740 [Alphaproteobacteria bacterium]|nr:hypothetical protein [Alphaproteobacteria bacterium]
MIKSLTTYLIIIVAGASLLLGSTLMLLKPSEELAHQYLALAHSSLEQTYHRADNPEAYLNQTLQALTLAAQYQPYNAEIWQALSSVYSRMYQTHQAEYTQEIAQMLEDLPHTAPKDLKQNMVSLSFRLSPASTVLP